MEGTGDLRTSTPEQNNVGNYGVMGPGSARCTPRASGPQWQTTGAPGHPPTGGNGPEGARTDEQGIGSYLVAQRLASNRE
eukprot:1839953-Pyramimonas_sp.AAC.1